MILGSLPYIRYVQLVNGIMPPCGRTAGRAYLRWLGAAVLIGHGLAGLDDGRRRRAGLSRGPVQPDLDHVLDRVLFRQLPGLGRVHAGGGLCDRHHRGLFGVVGGGAVGVPGAGGAGGAAPRDAADRQPVGVDPVRYTKGGPVGEDVINALIMFISSYILILGVMTVAMTLLGRRHRNVGAVRGLDHAWQHRLRLRPAGGTDRDLHRLSPGAIVIMTLAMILGRLGLLAILVLLLPRFWRR
jgi:trk system potassium uptake protein TrkH